LRFSLKKSHILDYFDGKVGGLENVEKIKKWNFYEA
jgi:hypothetical protein